MPHMSRTLVLLMLLPSIALTPKHPTLLQIITQHSRLLGFSSQLASQTKAPI